MSKKIIIGIITISLVIIAMSIFYSFVLRPIQEDKPYKECIKSAELIKKSRDDTYIKDNRFENNPVIVYSDYINNKDSCYLKYKK